MSFFFPHSITYWCPGRCRFFSLIQSLIEYLWTKCTDTHENKTDAAGLDSWSLYSWDNFWDMSLQFQEEFHHILPCNFPEAVTLNLISYGKLFLGIFLKIFNSHSWKRLCFCIFMYLLLYVPNTDAACVFGSCKNLFLQKQNRLVVIIKQNLLVSKTDLFIHCRNLIFTLKMVSFQESTSPF